MAVVGLVGIIFGAVVAAAYGGIIGKSAFPVSWFYVLIVISGCILFISSIGVLSIHKYWRYGTCGFLFLTILLLIAVAVIMTTLILYANGESGALESTVRDVQGQLESYLFNLAMTNPTEWKSYQAALACCGISYQALYKVYPEGKSINDVLNGARCIQTENAISIINSFLNTYPTYNLTVQREIDRDPVIGDDSKGFFCIANILETSKKYTVQASVVSGTIVLIQILSIYLVFDLFCRVREADGGFAVLDKAVKPTTSGEVLAPDQETGLGGSVLLKPGARASLSTQAQQFAGRMSYRMGFAPHTPSPRGPPPPTILAAQMSFGSPQPIPTTELGSSIPYSNLSDGLPMPNSGLPQPNAGFLHSPPGFGAIKEFGQRMSVGFKQTFGHIRPPPPPPSRQPIPVPTVQNLGAPPSLPSPILPPPLSLPNLGGPPRPPPPPVMPDLGFPKPKSIDDAASTVASAGSAVGTRDDAKYKKYIMMEKCNLPEGAIRQKMTMDGMSQSEQDAFFISV